jgi:hypothetical protein
MKTKIILLALGTCILASSSTFGQEFTQVLRGTVKDSETQVPIPFATISIHSLETPIGTTSDTNGVFRLEDVPVGRHDVQVSFVGYETQVIPELMLTSGKEIVLEIGLKEKVTQMEEVVIKAYTKKDKPINSMALVSARTFSVEEARRYAGGFDDPARLAGSFAGVATTYLDDNSIIIRGNAPKGLLWRLEGIEIANPNHFAGMTTFGGGGVSALSSLMLANSDFFTGAFPAEYGNAMSGVFDIKLRTGNNEHYEHAVQVGALGIDISAEGPFSKKSRASYLFNYRYSTFGLIKPILPEGTNVPIYQDLSLKINVPTKSAGVFSLWALGADNKIKFEAETDTSEWSYLEDPEFGDASQRMGAVGLNHRHILGPKTYLNSSYAVTADKTLFDEGVMDSSLDEYPTAHIDFVNHKHSITSTLNHKFSSRHNNRTGFVVNSLHSNTLLQHAPVPGEPLLTTARVNTRTMLYRFFTQSKFTLGTKFKLNAGIHSQYFALNEEFIAEPRVGVTYQVSNRHALSLAYGKHSRLEPLSIYFARVETGKAYETPNENLRLSKAHHFVLAYDLSLNQHHRLKIEPYLQLLYDVPVIQDSSYSTINMEADWFFTEKLNNSGTGTNLGMDVTLERFLHRGFYYLVTASLFNSSYTGGDGVERNTRFNSNYVCNVLFGKEWVLGAAKNRILGINGRLNVLGGQRTIPVDEDLSHRYGELIYDYSRAFEAQKPMVYHLNASINYRVNKKKHSSISSLQVMNLLGSEEHYGYRYNYRSDAIEEDAVAVVVPSISYKIEF